MKGPVGESSVLDFVGYFKIDEIKERPRMSWAHRDSEAKTTHNAQADSCLFIVGCQSVYVLVCSTLC